MSFYFSVISVETVVLTFVFFLLVSNFPFETLIVFSLVSNLLVLRFLSLFVERTLRNAVRRQQPDWPPEVGREQVA